MTSGLALADSIILGVGNRTGTELILATKPYAVDITARSWWCILSTTALWLGAIFGALFAPHPALKLACSVLAGLFLLRLFVIYHDQQHNAILPTSRLAERVMRVFGILALSPSSIWRSSHNHHHHHNSKIKGSHIGSFPIMTKDHYLKASKSARVVSVIVGALGCDSHERHRVEITGTQGRIEFEFFAESPLRLVTADGVQEIALPNPQHVQQPLIQTIVDDLNGQGVCPANAEAALRTTAVVDRILASFRRRAA